MNDKVAADKTEAKRKKVIGAMRYVVEGGEPGIMHLGNIIDVGPHELSFEAHFLIPAETKIRAELSGMDFSEQINIQGVIREIEEIEKDKKYYYCLVFDKNKEEEQRKLEKWFQQTDIDNILKLAVKRNASDIHLLVDKPPFFRIKGELVTINVPPLSSQALRQMISGMISKPQRQQLEETLELDFSYSLPDGNRFRGNAHFQRGKLEVALRAISTQIRVVPELGLPPIVEKLARKKRGLIIVTGPAGSGKSTTLAAMIDVINRETKSIVVSIEDPIEYVYEMNQSVIKQREVGVDTLSFNNALKHILRQDPNVILIGEVRDLESISLAITAAETGHLVFTTLHTPNTVETINRIVDVYPSGQQEQIRCQLAGCLEAIIGQVLLPAKDGKGRVIATEVLVMTPAIRNVIRAGKLGQINSFIETGINYGMQLMDQSLLKLVKEGKIDKEIAFGFMRDAALLEDL